ncbi:hypothetical protein D3C80_2027120 [compost metagenome]
MIVSLDIDVELDDHVLEEHKIGKETVEHRALKADYAERVSAEIKKRVGITTNVCLHDQDALPKCEAGKLNRIIR